VDRIEDDGRYTIILSTIHDGQWFASPIDCHVCGFAFTVVHQDQAETYPCPECGVQCHWPPTAAGQEGEP